MQCGAGLAVQCGAVVAVRRCTCWRPRSMGSMYGAGAIWKNTDRHRVAWKPCIGPQLYSALKGEKAWKAGKQFIIPWYKLMRIAFPPLSSLSLSLSLSLCRSLSFSSRMHIETRFFIKTNCVWSGYWIIKDKPKRRTHRRAQIPCPLWHPPTHDHSGKLMNLSFMGNLNAQAKKPR